MSEKTKIYQIVDIIASYSQCSMWAADNRRKENMTTILTWEFQVFRLNPV